MMSQSWLPVQPTVIWLSFSLSDGLYSVWARIDVPDSTALLSSSSTLCLLSFSLSFFFGTRLQQCVCWTALMTIIFLFFFILKHNSLNRCRHLWDVCVVLIDSLQPRGDHSCFHQAHRRQWSQSFFHIFQPWSFRVFFHELLDLPLSTSCSWLTFVGVLRLSLFSSVYGTNLFFFCTFLPQKTFCLQFSDTIHLTGCIWCWPPQCNLLWSGC